MSEKYEWKLVRWNSGWDGAGKKMPSGERFTLPLFLEGLEDEGWEIFSINSFDHTVDKDVIVRKRR